MSIKAKTVEKDRAAAFDRGQFTKSPAASSAKRSYYYEAERHQEEMDREASRSSSSSSSPSTSRSSSSPITHSTKAPSRPHARRDVHDTADASGSDTSEDEEVVRRARAATQALLGGSRPASAAAKSSGASSSMAAAAAPPNMRLEAYLRARAASAPTVNASELASFNGGNHPTRAPATTAATAATRTTSHSTAQRTTASDGPQSNAAVSHKPGEAVALSEGLAGDTSVSPSAAVTEALQMRSTNADFQQLMALLETDVRREQAERKSSALITADPQASDFHRPANAEARTQPQPTRNFSALENTALEQLFEDWCHQEKTSVSETAPSENADGDGDVFIAADHRAAAFTLAAVAARDLDASSWGRRAQPGTTADPLFLSSSSSSSAAAAAAAVVANAPLTWEELMQSEVARRNARKVGGRATTSGTMLSSPADVAAQATQQLRRFLQSVDCIERLVSSRAFMRAVAAYLYEHHKVFLPHYQASRSPSPMPTPAASLRVDAADGAAPASAVVEHRHEEYAVYEEFGQRVSGALLSLLYRNVEGFDEAEFVEALYDTPATFSTAGETTQEGEDEAVLRGPQNVLSFPAWRLVLAMSDFESFFAWMMDYIYEEYHLDGLAEEDGPAVAVAGARGLRALIRSTYKRSAETSAEAAVPAGQTASPLRQPSPDADRLADVPIPSPPDTTATPPPPQTSSPLITESPLRPSGPLAPLPSTTSLPPAPAPARASLSSSLGGAGGSARLRQFFPTPPASAEGSTRVAAGKAAAPVYRKRQTTNPGRNLPPITASTDTLVRASSAQLPEAESSTSHSRSELSASMPVPLRVADVGAAKKATVKKASPKAASAAPSKVASAAPAPARRPSHAKLLGEKSPAVAAGGGGSRRGSKTSKPASRTASSTRVKSKDAPAEKPHRPKLQR